MPVIEIATLPTAGEIDVASALGNVATEVAAFLGEEARGTWAIHHPIAPGSYAEGRDTPRSQPAETHPAIVRVLANREQEDVARLLEAVGDAVVRAFGLEEGNVVVLWEPADPDRMFWG
jgi:hypothetical protein